MAVDLHREIREVAEFYRLPYSFWQRETVVVDFKGLALRVLQPELALVHLCLHAFNDRYVYHWKDYDARQLLDIGLMVRRLSMDWAKAYREATRAACLVPLALVLQKVNHCFPECIPARALEQFADARPTTLERIILTRRLGYFTNYLPICLNHSLRELLFYFSAKLWPDTEYISGEALGPSRSAYFRQFFRKLLHRPQTH